MSCPKPYGAAKDLAPMINRMLKDHVLTAKEARELRDAGHTARSAAIAHGEAQLNANREMMDAFLIAVGTPDSDRTHQAAAHILGVTRGAGLSELAATAKRREYQQALDGVTHVRRGIDEIVKGTSNGKQMLKQLERLGLGLSAADIAALKRMPKPPAGLFQAHPTQHEIEDAKTRAWIHDAGARIEVQIPNRGHEHLEQLEPILDKIAKGMQRKEVAALIGRTHGLDPASSRFLKQHHGCGDHEHHDHMRTMQSAGAGATYLQGKMPSLKNTAVAVGDVPKSTPMPLQIMEWNGMMGMGDHHLQWHINSKQIQPAEDRGLRFLAMHHVMLDMYRKAPWAPPDQRAQCAKDAAPLFAGWPTNKPPSDLQHDPEYGASVKLMMNIKENAKLFKDDKAFGNWLESQAGPMIQKTLAGTHNAMHMKYADKGRQTEINMGDPGKNLNNQLFFQLHGWIDNVWNDFRAAKKAELSGAALESYGADYDKAMAIETKGWKDMMSGHSMHA